MDLSASPSNATPKSACSALTVSLSSWRFSGRGSGMRPGKVPSMLALRLVILHPKSRSRGGAVSPPTLLAASTTTWKCFSAILAVFTCVFVVYA